MYIGYQLYHLSKLLICALCTMKLLAIYGTRLVVTKNLHIKQAATTTKQLFFPITKSRNNI